MLLKRPTPVTALFFAWVGRFCLVGFFLSTCLQAQSVLPPIVKKSASPAISQPHTVSVAKSPQSAAALIQKADKLLQLPTPENLRQATGLYQSAAVAFRESGEFEAEALAWHRVSLLSKKTGDSLQAKQSADKARMVLRARTLPATAYSVTANAQAARAYLTLGRIQLESGEVRDAYQSYQNGLFLAGNAKLPRESAAAQVALGLLASEANEDEAAIQLTLNSVQQWRAARDFSGEALALNNLARLYEKKGDLKRAAEYDQQAIAIHRLSHNANAENQSLTEALRLYLALQNYEAAALACEQLIGLSHLKDDPRKESEDLMALALIEAQRGQSSSAFQLLLKAFIIGTQNNAPITAEIKDHIAQIEAKPKNSLVSGAFENYLVQAESAGNQGNYAVAYRLLLHALLTSDQTTDVVRTSMTAQIKALMRQLDARQKKITPTMQ